MASSESSPTIELPPVPPNIPPCYPRSKPDFACGTAIRFMSLGPALARSGVEAALKYLRLHVLLDRRGVAASSPRVYRVYRKEGLAVRLHEQLAGGKSRPVLEALIRIGWREQRQSGSHVILARPGLPDFDFASRWSSASLSECLNPGTPVRKFARCIAGVGVGAI